MDNFPSNIEIIAHTLKRSYRVKAATSGQKALDIARSAQVPDLIVLDIVMPDMDGLEVCRHLKSDPVTEPIPVIFLTGKSDPAAITAGFAGGGVDYVAKPAGPAVLEARVGYKMETGSYVAKAERVELSDVIRTVVRESEGLANTEGKQLLFREKKAYPVNAEPMLCLSLMRNPLRTWNQPRTMPWAEKDMLIILNMADDNNLPLPMAGFIKEYIKAIKVERGLYND